MTLSAVIGSKTFKAGHVTADLLPSRFKVDLVLIKKSYLQDRRHYGFLHPAALQKFFHLVHQECCD